MKDHLRHQFAASLQVEFTHAFVKTSQDKNKSSASVEEEGKESEPAVENAMKKSSPFAVHMADSLSTFAEISSSMVTTKEEVQAMEHQLSAIKEEESIIVNQIRTENLDQALQDSMTEVETKTMEHQDENRRCSQLKTTLNKTRASIGDYTGSYVNQVSYYSCIWDE